MQLRTISRLAAAGAVVCAVAGAIVGMAGATGHERVTLRKDEVLEFDYPAMVGNNAVVQLDDSLGYDPAVCATVTYCDTIPLRIEAPANLTDDEEYFVRITVTWVSPELDNPAGLGDAAANDVDMVIWNDPIVPGIGPDEDGAVAKSKSFGIPEVINLYQPIGDYNLVVSNVTGANVGYHVKFEWITDVLPNPFESLPPEFTGGGPVRPATPAPSRPAPAASSPPVARPPVVDLPDVPRADLTLDTPPIASQAFETGFGDVEDFDETLSAPSPFINRQYTPVVQDLPDPSGAAVLLWLVAFPLLVVAIGGAFLARRQKHALAI